MARPKAGRRVPVEHYQHGSASRSNLPTEQTEPLMEHEQKAPLRHVPRRRGRDEEPVLAWDRGDEPSDYAAHPLYIREKIHPGAFIESLRKGNDSQQASLFEDFNGYRSPDAAYEWYKHTGNWQNRIIHGESAHVMASLAEQENLAGQVQMIFFDPPYGIGFKSNFQVSTRNRETPTGRKGLPADTRTIRAFRDTYKRGVHSYLDQVLQKLVLCRELLAESGSLFMQIGDKNVHRIAVLLDEVFGAENRVATIPFATSGSTSANTLPSVADFLLWYAKNKSQVRYNQLFEPLTRAQKIKHMSFHAMVELAGGSTRKLSPEERRNPDKYLPDGSRLYRRMPLASPGTSTTGRSEPYFWNGHLWPCPRAEQWRVSMRGMDRLAELGRLDASGPGGYLGWKRYEEEVGGRRVNNLWRRQKSTSDKRYVVQTANSVIERCVLMSTDPGDLVFDPTCGGGTTALVAETWGRRWITCDTSPIATAIARQRLATATHKYWLLNDSAEGAKKEAEVSGEPVNVPPEGGWGNDPSRGFVCKRVPYVSAATLAYDKKPPPTMLVDRPYAKPVVVRVSSPFTVESSSPHSYVPLEGPDPASSIPLAHGEFVDRVTEELLRSPIRGGRTTADIYISDIEAWAGRDHIISHRAVYTIGSGSTEYNAAVQIISEDATVSPEMLRAASLEAAVSPHNCKLLIIIAYDFDPACDTSFGRIETALVRMHRDLQIDDLKPKKDHHAFVMIGQPDLEIHDERENLISVELLGYDTYNPATGTVDMGLAKDVSCWMIDTNHDEYSFFARAIHFPGAGNDKQMKRLKKQLGTTLDTLKWNRSLSTRSTPFPRPETGKIAVKIITTTGIEMSVTRSIRTP